MTHRDDDELKLKMGRPRTRGTQHVRFASRVLKAVSIHRAEGRSRLPAMARRKGPTRGRGDLAMKLTVRTPGLRSRRVVIKTRLVILNRVSRHSTLRHLKYIEREGVTKDGEITCAYGPDTDHADTQAFEARGREDRHQFRFIVSSDDATELNDLRGFTRDLMARVEQDMETRLDWVAVDHWDTDNPHTHIVLRGKDQNLRDLIIAREYLSHGMRARASELATTWLGPRTEREIRESLTREVDQERWTSLDRTLCQESNRGVIDLRDLGGEAAHGNAAQGDALPGVAQHRFQRSLKIGRLQFLAKMGLARETSSSVWTISAQAEPVLRSMGERGDIIRTMQRAFSGVRREVAVFDAKTTAMPVIGRIAATGLADELQGRGYLIVDGVDGRGHYVALSADTDISQFSVGSVVEIRGTMEFRESDRTIAALADQGVYRTEKHLALLRAQSPRAKGADAYVEAHVRRLEALRRAGVVERLDAGVWKVPNDLPARGQHYDARQRDGAQVTVLSHRSIERQTRVIGATWLDRQLVGENTPLTDQGFGATVREALKERATFLVDQGFAERQGHRMVPMRNLLATLRSRELSSAATTLSAETGLAHREPMEGERISGIYRRSVSLASGRFAMLEEGLGFTLVPWRAVIEPRLGQSISGVVRGHSISWELGRSRGLSR